MFPSHDLGDNEKIRFGASQDLEIYHDGSDSIIHDNGTGNLKIRATNLRILNAAGTQNLISHNDGGDVKLYHAGNQKFATTSSGIDVTGSVTAVDYRTDGSNPFYLTSAADWRFRTTGGSERVRITSSGNVGINETSPASRLHITGTDGGWDKHITIEHDGSDIGKILVDTDGMKFRNMSNGNGS